MSQQTLESLKYDLNDYSIIPVNKQAKFLKELFPNDLVKIFKIIENFKIKPNVIFFNSPNFDEYITVLINGTHDWILELSNNFFNFYKCKTDHICLVNSQDKILKRLIPVIIGILFTEWNFNDEDDNEYKNYFLTTFKEFLKNFKENNLKKQDCDTEYLEELIHLVRENPDSFIRIDLLHHQLPIFKLRKKKSSKKIKEKNISPKISFSEYNNIELETKEKQLVEYLNKKENSWLARKYFLKFQQIKMNDLENNGKPIFEHFTSTLNDEFNEILNEMELIDGYGDENEHKLKELVNSIIDDKLANRSSNKLIIGPQGTGKSSFPKLLGRLMNARVLTIECGPLTDNSDLFGSYEIIIDPETRQAVTIYNENGFMYASKLVQDGHKVVLAVEEYNLLPSETLLKQLNRFFQDRVISSMGGRYEIGLESKEDFIVIMTGNHDFNQDWLSDVGLIRRFEFFEFPLPSTESVVECLFNYVNNSEFNIRLSYECAERIAEIRDDLVSCLQEKTIRPILSKEIKYPDLFTLRNFALDLIHNVDISIAVRRWLVKIILGGIPNDPEQREEYFNYARIIQTTVEDRLPEVIVEKLF